MAKFDLLVTELAMVETVSTVRSVFTYVGPLPYVTPRCLSYQGPTSKPMGIIELTTSRPLGAHVATPLQDLYAELHTHTQYKALRTTYSHTHFSLKLFPEVLLITK